MNRKRFTSKLRTPEEFREDFWAKVAVRGDDDCWLFQGRWKGGSGHGIVRKPAPGSVKTGTAAHRVAWELSFGEIPKGLQVHHSCDMPLCCNPKHLWLGTQLDNMRDKMKKDRHLSKKALDSYRLKPAQVIRIRKIGSALTQVELAKKFGVSRYCIQSVLCSRSWRHLV